MDSKSSHSSSPPTNCIKKEAPEEEIKEFAETAMNELLGWYGYERLELRRWAAAASRVPPASPESAKSQDKDKDECSWCNNPITTDTALHQSGAKFCSELCFSQSRRANFKRAKTCDWCRHVRHTVAYVDFQDGATQLQFCSDKCLNQYKMHIFCRETQAHLDLNPHLVGSSATTSNLITPDLWLKNCRSRSVSPSSEKSKSPGTAENLSQKSMEKLESSRPGKKSPLPLIKITPSSKLLKPKQLQEETNLHNTEPKKDLRNSRANLRKRRSSRCTSTVTSQSLARQNSASTPKIQDSRMSSPPSTLDPASPTSSTLTNHVVPSPPQTINSHQAPQKFPHNFSAPMFSSVPPPSSIYDGIPPHHMTDPRFPRTLLHHPPNFLQRPGVLFNERPRLPPPPLPFMQMGMGQPPPVTIFVPYPIPIPLPIPVPIPLPAIMQAYNLRRTPSGLSTQSADDDGTEGPLDFTMNADKTRDGSSSQDCEKKENLSSNENLVNDTKSESEVNNPEQTLPRFKITRLGKKTAKIVTKHKDIAESTRVLSKRRKLVEVQSDDDCAPLISKSRKIVQV